MTSPDSKSNWNVGPTQRLPKTSVSTVVERPIQPRRRRRTWLIAIGAVLLLIVLVVGGAALWAWNRYQTVADSVIVDISQEVVNPANPNPEPAADNQSNPDNAGGVVPTVAAKPRPTPDIVKDPFNVLLIGVDIREDVSDARTDTIIVMHVDPVNKWANMLSIPRDSCAQIPGYNGVGECEKINAAYTYGYRDAPEQRLDPVVGGMRLTRDTVERYLDINIDYTMQVDFKGFRKIIDTIGGVSINVARPLWDPQYPTDDNDNGFIRLYIPAGFQHMDGTMALRYARSRHADSDYGRSQRQQDVIRAIMQALRERGLFDQIDTLNQLGDQLEGTFYTDMPIDDIGNVRALADLGSDLAEGRMQSLTWPTGVDLGGADLYTPRWDPANIAAAVAALTSGPVPNTNGVPASTATPAQLDESVRIEVMNGVGLRGLAGDIADHLANRGWTLNDSSDASTIYDTTVIIDYGNNKATRNQLAAELGIKPKNILLAEDAPELAAYSDTNIVVLLGRDYKEAWRTK